MNGNTYKDALNEASFILKEIENPIREAILLLSHTAGVEVAKIYAFQETQLDIKTYQDFISRCRERSQGKPFHYIVGDVEFYSLQFKVTPDVLIPRPDTEHLVERGLEFLNNLQSNKNLRVLDLCTGSGCIAISIAANYSKCDVIASDISDSALKVAKTNICLHNLANRITLVKSDMFKQIEGNFDLILCNPPYIPKKDIIDLQREVTQFEPHLALDGGLDGLDFYRLLSFESISKLRPNGAIGMEVGVGQAQEVVGFFNELNAYNLNESVNINTSKEHYKCTIIKDFSGIERVVFIIKNCIQ